MNLGLISDTHGLLRPDVFQRLAGVDRILHAGDIGPPDILVELEALAPVSAVWGNTDGFELRQALDEVVRLDVAGVRIVLVHGHQLGTPTPGGLRAAHPDANVIVHGHTHRQRIDRDDGTLVINPGAAGAARFAIPPSVARLRLGDGPPVAEILELLQ